MASLPMGNPPRAAQMLLQQLRLLVRDPEPGTKFSTLLDLYLGPVGRLLEIVTERFDDNVDLAVQMDQLESTLVDLLSEIALGKLRVANELSAAGKAVPTPLLYSTMDLLDKASTIERLHYCARNPARWRQMLSVFLYAEQRHADREAVPIPPRSVDAPETIRGLFFRVLVIGLCDPHRHRPGDILRWHRWLGRHTADLSLALLPQGAFSIPVDISGEMEPLTAARRGKPGAEMRYLSAESFLEHLKADAEAPEGLYLAIDDLVRGRKASDQRASPRCELRHPFRLLYGVRTVHARLEQLGMGRGADAPPAVPIDATQINQSKTGAAFVLAGPVQPPLAVGETVLAEADNPRPGGGPIGFVARIQRVVSKDDGSIEIGVARLPGRMVPVHLSGGTAERARGDTYALLQQVPDTGAFRLIAASAIFRERESVTVEGVNLRLDLTMLKLHPVTRRLGYIEVEVLA